jgi:uncharacterized protein involved in type VI secretion and phage assembly
MTTSSTTRLEERLRGHFYGKYRGFVVDHSDPEGRGRVRLRVPSVLGDQTSAWALPCLPFGGRTEEGFFMVPEVDAQVWVEFEEGNLHHPIWTGVFWQSAHDVPAEGRKTPPTTRVLKTPSGHVLQFDDEAGVERFRLSHPAGAELTIDESGTVDLVNAHGEHLVLDAEGGKVVLESRHGNRLTLDASGVKVEDSNGNSVTMAAASLTVSGTKIVLDAPIVALGGEGGEPLLKAASFLGWLATHTHNCTAPGAPSGPPVPPPNPSFFTTKTTAQ